MNKSVIRIHAHAERFSQGHWTSLDPGSEENGEQDTATNLRENGIPSFPRWCSESKIQSASALSREKKKNQTLQCGILKHRASISNSSLSESRISVKSWNEDQTGKK